MRIVIHTAMVTLIAVSQIQGQLSRDPTGPFPAPQPTPVEKDSTRKQVLTVVSLVSAAAALGAVVLAHQYMSRADAAYERYLHAGNPSQMNRYFNQAQDYDRRAGITLAVFELCFTVTVFSVFSSLTL
ncbi:MAG: hypothetical protein ACE5HZ_01400 [Fidelibacterota bacterium]